MTGKRHKCKSSFLREAAEKLIDEYQRQKAEETKRERINREELEQFLDSPRVHIIQMDEETADFYANIFWDLKKKGTPIPTNDIWVAASTMRHGVHLFTHDRHFENIDGLLLLLEGGI